MPSSCRDVIAVQCEPSAEQYALYVLVLVLISQALPLRPEHLALLRHRVPLTSGLVRVRVSVRVRPADTETSSQRRQKAPRIDAESTVGYGQGWWPVRKVRKGTGEGEGRLLSSRDYIGQTRGKGPLWSRH